MFILYNNDTQEFETFTQKGLFEMINRDRSNEWSDYDQNSTIKEVTEVINDMCLPYSIDMDMPFKTGSE